MLSGNRSLLDYQQLQLVDGVENKREGARQVLNVLISCKTAIVKDLWTNRPMKRMSAHKRNEYENASKC